MVKVSPQTGRHDSITLLPVATIEPVRAEIDIAVDPFGLDLLTQLTEVFRRKEMIAPTIITVLGGYAEEFAWELVPESEDYRAHFVTSAALTRATSSLWISLFVPMILATDTVPLVIRMSKVLYSMPISVAASLTVI